MGKELMVGGASFALFIICPRMAGMAHVIAEYSRVPLIHVALLGSVLSLPLVVTMVLIFSKFGVGGALAFCVFTDCVSALIVKELNLKAGLETLIIAGFIIVGIKTAPYLTSVIVKR